MRRPRPSLVRRLTLGFFFVYLVALSSVMLLAYPLLIALAEEHEAPEVAIAFVAEDLVVGERAISLRPGPDLKDLLDRNPRLWFVASGHGKSLTFGAVPDSARRSLAASGGALKFGDFRYPAPRGPLEDWSAEELENPEGVLLALGGVDPRSLGLADYSLFLYKTELYIAALALAALTFLGGAAAIPIVLRSVRPTVRAVGQLDFSDLRKRLPETHVVKELLPIVRAFNSALDRLAAAFERRRRFIADVAHELRTPLAVLNMHVDALADGGNKPDLQRTVFRLGQMVGQMLDAERLAMAGTRRERVDLVELCRGAVADIAPLAVANGYEIGLSAESDTIVVRGDPYALSRAIANLIGNAIAHGGGSGAIEVRVGATGCVDVTDEGPGVPAEARERIFEPFHRERWDKDGCGLGLHLVREIMTAHGGQVQLLGSPTGALFRLRFPAGEVAA